ncbi:hypothetical protein EG329_004329 [Mollisiaceae sp. DMI_Dod_QoI]|nr:hypothetical protein EG329_004329 [Helotiales sp. DMI_Dod_QoI]
MSSMEGVQSQSAVVPHFLRIPKEIRLAIYRQLLFPSQTIFMTPIVGAPESSDEEEWTDEDSEDRDTEDEFDEMLWDGGKEYFTTAEANPFTKSEYDNFKRHPAILRTNHQIYSEASSLLYTEAVLSVSPGDIFCLRKKPKALAFGIRHADVWRYNPLQGTGIQEGCKVVYDTTAMGGAMEPHVFARFQKIYFDANFDFEHTQCVELWIDDDTHVIRSDDAAAYQKILRSSSVMKDFVKLLSKSRQITHLEICLEVEVMANSNLMMEEMPEDEEDADEAEDKVDRLMDIASEKATELFLDSKICDPLLKLSNVKTFQFEIGFEDGEEDEVYKPPQKYLDLFQSMKKQIEGNFKEPTLV